MIALSLARGRLLVSQPKEKRKKANRLRDLQSLNKRLDPLICQKRLIQKYLPKPGLDEYTAQAFIP